MRITWLGHSTAAIEAAGTVVLTDPVLRARIVHLRRLVPIPPAPERVDAVLLSHAHHDHLDLPSLAHLGAPVIASPGACRTLRRAGREARELRVGETTMVGTIAVTAVPALHDGRRWPLGVDDDGALGFVLRAEGRSAYFAGDTGLFDGMRAIGPVDVALLPIIGWGPRLGPGHLGPDDAAAAVALVRPAIAIPIHWGTFAPIHARRGASDPTAPVREFREHVVKLAPGVEVAALAVGESLELPPTAERAPV